MWLFLLWFSRWRFAVGTPITVRPPHRSERAQFGHSAPTLGGRRQALRLSVRGPAPVTCQPGSVSGACVAGPRSPWSRALAPPAPPPAARLCSSASQLLCRVRLLQIVHHRLRLLAFPMRTIRPVVLGTWPIQRSPGSRTRSVRTCQGLRPRRTGQALALARPSVLPSASITASASEMNNLSRLNGWPMRSPTDASPTPSRMPRTARGRCGLLLLHRGGLSPSTPCRSPGALSTLSVLSPSAALLRWVVRIARSASCSTPCRFVGETRRDRRRSQRRCLQQRAADLATAEASRGMRT